jgi:hypothetical protein
MYINTIKDVTHLQEVNKTINLKLPGQPVFILNDSWCYLDVPAAPNARTAVMAPKTMLTHEALTKALNRTQIPSEQIARLSNFTC